MSILPVKDMGKIEKKKPNLQIFNLWERGTMMFRDIKLNVSS